MSDLLTWIALRRVHTGRVACVVGCWVDGGYRVPCYLLDTLNELTEVGLVVLADDGPHGPLRRASLTDAGQTRYAALREQHGERNARAESEVPAPDIRVEDGPSGTLCLLCVVGAVADVPDPGNWGLPL